MVTNTHTVEVLKPDAGTDTSLPIRNISRITDYSTNTRGMDNGESC